MSCEPTMLACRRGRVYSETSEDLGEPSSADIEEFAKRIGIQVDKEPELLYLAKEGLNEKLPHPWKPCLDTNRNSWYYFNEQTLTSQWEHPLNAVYREKVEKARMNLASSTNTFSAFPAVGKLPHSLPPVKKLGGASRPQSSKLVTPLSTIPSTSTGDSNVMNGNNANDLKGLLTAKPFMDAVQEARSQKKVEPEISFIKKATPIGKKGTGLTLTGNGTNFVKGKAPLGTGTSKTEESRIESEEEFSNYLHDLNPKTAKTTPAGNSGHHQNRKPAGNNGRAKTQQKGNMWNVTTEGLTEEEIRIWQDIDKKEKEGTQDKSNSNSVKFRIDENTELKFEISADENDEKASSKEAKSITKSLESDETTNTNETSRDEDDSFSDKMKSLTPKFGVGINKHKHNTIAKPKPKSPMGNKIRDRSRSPKGGRMSEAALAAQKAVLKRETEFELKKLQNQLEAERKEKESLYRKELDEKLKAMKAKHEDAISKTKENLEKRRVEEIKKLQASMETKLMGELEKVERELERKFDAQKDEILQEHKKTIESFKIQLKQKEDEARLTAAEMSKVEENMNFEDSKASLQMTHAEEIEKLKEYHASIIESLQSEFKAEQEKLIADHKVKLQELTHQLETEHANTIEKLKANNESDLADINKTFLLRKAEVLKENQSTLDELERSLRQQQLPVTKSNMNIRTNPSLTSQSIIEQQENESMINDKEVELWKLKYKHLEDKYDSLKRELQDVLSLVHLQQEQRKAVATATDNQDSLVLIDNEDSANGSGTNSDSSFYHNSSLQHQIHTQTLNTGPMDMDGIIVGNTDRLEEALKALEVLKTQINELKRDQIKQQTAPSSAKRSNTPNNNNINIKSTKQHGANVHSHSNPKPPTKHRKSHRKDEKTSHLHHLPGGDTTRIVKHVKVTTQPLGNTSLDKEAEVLDKYIKVSKSVSDLLHPDDQDKGDYSNVVEEAKNLLRAQKLKSGRIVVDNRFEREGRPTPDSTTWFVPSKEGKQILLENVAEKPHTHRKSRSGRTSYFVPTTTTELPSESSGVGSMRDLHNTERIKVATDIDSICASLAHLDDQMKLMWSYVRDSEKRKKKSGVTETASDGLNVNSNIRRYLESASMVQQNNNNSSSSLPSRRVMESFQPTSSLGSGSTLSAALLLPQNNLLSLGPEYQQFQATKDRIMNKFSSGSLSNLRSDKLLSSGTSTADVIKEKTKDLKNWLEKF